MKIPFFKMSGGGNDFIIIDNRNGILNGDDMGGFVRYVCQRNISVGADGLILIENSGKVDFKWRYFNADGGEVEMCGNGGRCVSRFAYINGIAKERLSFETKVGVIDAEVMGRRVKLKMPLPHNLKTGFTISIDGKIHNLSSINTGVPHTIEVVDNLESVDVVKIGRYIRHHERFEPEGTNANFMNILDLHNICIRTYERGVEDETLACGTGSVAGVLIASIEGKVESPVSVKTKGGDILTIYFKREGLGFNDLYLEGDTRVVYTGELWEEGYN
ncbi:MAG: diaminopimelate epimerase [Nitrospinae bacterium]|nr:diaminopimelate epimerase [Nitrospinota bacterium]